MMVAVPGPTAGRPAVGRWHAWVDQWSRRRVAEDLVPLRHQRRVSAARRDGTAYFSDRDEQGGRLVARSPDDRWRVIAAQLTTDFAGPSTAAVGPGGQLYIEDDVGLHLVSADGRVDTVVRIDGWRGSHDAGAPPLPAAQPPVPAQDVVLSDVWGLVVGPDGTVFASNRHEIVAIDPTGTLTLVTTMADLRTDLGILSTLDPPYLWSGLAIDADGSLLVSDPYQQLVADLDGPTIVARNAVVVSNGLDCGVAAPRPAAAPTRPPRLAGRTPATRRTGGVRPVSDPDV